MGYRRALQGLRRWTDLRSYRSRDRATALTIVSQGASCFRFDIEPRRDVGTRQEPEPIRADLPASATSCFSRDGRLRTIRAHGIESAHPPHRGVGPALGDSIEQQPRGFAANLASGLEMTVRRGRKPALQRQFVHACDRDVLGAANADFRDRAHGAERHEIVGAEQQIASTRGLAVRSSLAVARASSTWRRFR